MSDEPPPRYPTDKDQLLRDFTVAGRIHDIRETARLKERLAPRWWEAAVGLVQFAAALGLLAALMQHPALWDDPARVQTQLSRMIVFWVTLMILSLVLGFEFLIFRLYHLRRAYAIAMRRIEELERRVDKVDPADAPPADPPPALTPPHE
jgi:hypothetical protein